MTRIQLARCWSCMTGCCFDPPQPHTWIGDEDAEHAGHPWPLPPEIAADNPCACECAGGPGGCVNVPDDELPEAIQQVARQALKNPPGGPVNEPARHTPAIAPAYDDGVWGVYCLGCSDTAGEYVLRCRINPDREWPPPWLRAAEPVATVTFREDQQHG